MNAVKEGGYFFNTTVCFYAFEESCNNDFPGKMMYCR